MSNEVLDLLARGVTQRLGAAEVDGIALHQVGIELVLANDLAKPIADLWAAAVSARRLRWELARLMPRLRGMGSRSDFIDRADADTVCLAQCTVDCTGLSNSQFCAVHEWRNIGGIGITETHESLARSRLVDDSFECPAEHRWFTEIPNRFCVHTPTMFAISQTHEAGMGDIPTSVEDLQITRFHRESVFLDEKFQLFGFKSSNRIRPHYLGRLQL